MSSFNTNTKCLSKHEHFYHVKTLRGPHTMIDNDLQWSALQENSKTSSFDQVQGNLCGTCGPPPRWYGSPTTSNKCTHVLDVVERSINK